MHTLDFLTDFTSWVVRLSIGDKHYINTICSDWYATGRIEDSFASAPCRSTGVGIATAVLDIFDSFGCFGSSMVVIVETIEAELQLVFMVERYDSYLDWFTEQKSKLAESIFDIVKGVGSNVSRCV